LAGGISALMLVGILTNISNPAYAIRVPGSTAISGADEGTITIPEDTAAQLGIPPCHECAADITFDATQT
jgi:hypothetical protein